MALGFHMGGSGNVPSSKLIIVDGDYINTDIGLTDINYGRSGGSVTYTASGILIAASNANGGCRRGIITNTAVDFTEYTKFCFEYADISSLSTTAFLVNYGTVRNTSSPMTNRIISEGVLSSVSGTYEAAISDSNQNYIQFCIMNTTGNGVSVTLNKLWLEK